MNNQAQLLPPIRTLVCRNTKHSALVFQGRPTCWDHIDTPSVLSFLIMLSPLESTLETSFVRVDRSRE